MKAVRMVKIPIQIEGNIDVLKEMKEISEKYGECVDMEKIKRIIEEEYGD